jgi:hypothetical protein
LLYAAHEVAQRELEWDPTDPHNLDADDDGVACEEVADDGGAPLRGADDAQYRTEDKEVTVIVESIPDKNILVDAGTPAPWRPASRRAYRRSGITLLRRA